MFVFFVSAHYARTSFQSSIACVSTPSGDTGSGSSPNRATKVGKKALGDSVTDVAEGVLELLAVQWLGWKLPHLKRSEISLHFIPEVLNDIDTSVFGEHVGQKNMQVLIKNVGDCT